MTTDNYAEAYRKMVQEWMWWCYRDSAAWKNFQRRAKFANLTDDENRKLCLNGHMNDTEEERTFGFNGKMYHPNDHIKFQGSNPYTNDPVYQALVKIKKEDITDCFKNHRTMYVGNSRRHPRKHVHKRLIEQIIFNLIRGIEKRDVYTEEYKRAVNALETGNFLENMYRDTGNRINERQKVLMTLTDPKEIAYYLLTGNHDPAKAVALFNNPKYSIYGPMQIIAMYADKSDRINLNMGDPTLLRREAMRNAARYAAQ